ncbi:MAG: nucleotide exchange factor GrpE [Psychroflexus halocasei]|uniref:nucleotide exchange factor GrpE n=1 Tax=Psychroflexus sp. S27 TaxID=1982757 RepID=UPI000C298031|nr:nucleotide exchange factor GrpE [Psychroflexus sp. S27]PJX24066.1 nucleotide exchange factor GrpE [Psychroflexus sp. S27]
MKKEQNQKDIDQELKKEDVDVQSKPQEEKDVDQKESHDEQEAQDVEEKKELSKEEQLEESLNAEKDRYLRLFAEFENYKRRTSKERIELFKTAGEEVMQALLPILDDFDRALVELKKSKDKESFSGVELISNKFRETLRSKGLEPIAVKSGDTFDADLHEAVTQIPAPSDDLKGKIIDLIEKGYTLGDKIIRYPKVVTGK